MRRLLVIRTRKPDLLADQLADLEAQTPGQEVLVVSLHDPDPDYGELLEAIFQADSVQVF